MEGDYQKNRRKKYFINKKFQRNFIIKFCALVIIGSCISGSIIYLMTASTVTTVFENSRLTIKSTASFILPAVLLSSLIVTLIIGASAIVITLFTSHKIAGPLYRMEKDIEEVARGNLKKEFKLRESDELKALAESLDNMAQSLKTNIGELKQHIGELEASAGTSRIKQKLEKVREILAKYIT